MCLWQFFRAIYGKYNTQLFIKTSLQVFFKYFVSFINVAWEFVSCSFHKNINNFSLYMQKEWNWIVNKFIVCACCLGQDAGD